MSVSIQQHLAYLAAMVAPLHVFQVATAKSTNKTFANQARAHHLNPVGSLHWCAPWHEILMSEMHTFRDVPTKLASNCGPAKGWI